MRTKHCIDSNVRVRRDPCAGVVCTEVDIRAGDTHETLDVSMDDCAAIEVEIEVVLL